LDNEGLEHIFSAGAPLGKLQRRRTALPASLHMSLQELKLELEALRSHLAGQEDALQRLEDGELSSEQRERAEHMRAEIAALRERLDEAQQLVDAVEAEGD
jgi:hypothetical protein